MARLQFDPESLVHLPHAGDSYPLDATTLRVRLRSRLGVVKQCIVQWGDRYMPRENDLQQPMDLWARDADYDYWQAALPQPTHRVQYLFRVDDGEHRYWYGDEGLSLDEPGTLMTAGYFHHAFIHATEVFDTPQWAREGLVYQVFVDRFRNGDSSNDPKSTVPWGTLATGKMIAGGDLQGVIDSLDYLADLGVSTLYLTPIFLANTNHKYDTVDYTRIDPSVGDETALRRLLDGAHARSMHVVLDAVFNHAGMRFGPWLDVARNQERSRYKDWFWITSFPVDPRATEADATFLFFGNHTKLPKLNTLNPEVRRYLLGVAERWTRFGVDGWRLDAANEVDHAFWRDLRGTVRAVNPDALLVAEIWYQAAQFVRPGELDGLTHFPFMGAVSRFIAKQSIDAAEFVNRLTRARVPYQEQAVLWNVLGTHDTTRFLTECGNNKRKMHLALTLQLTYAGVPHIYYGDEVGLAGGPDPGCRGCMEWDPAKQDHDLYGHVRRLACLRLQHPALLRGSCLPLLAERGRRQFVYLRQWNDDAVVVAVNASSRGATVRLPAGGLPHAPVWRDVLSGTRHRMSAGALHLDLAPLQSAVLTVD